MSLPDLIGLAESLSGGSDGYREFRPSSSAVTMTTIGLVSARNS